TVGFASCRDSPTTRRSRTRRSSRPSRWPGSTSGIESHARGARMKPSAAWKALKRYAAEKPGAWEDHPWGETVYKVAKKVFVFLGHPDYGYGLSCKLPDSGEAAITMFSFAQPTGYGLGKAGWVSARLAAGANTSCDLSALTRPRGKKVSPFTCESDPRSRARALVRSGFRSPSRRRIAGRTKSSNPSVAAAGFPGSPNTRRPPEAVPNSTG